MKEIVLFRFHKKPLVVKNRIKLLKKYNPEIDIYGLFGGKEEDFPSMKRYLRRDLKNIYRVKPKYQGWMWLNGDLAVSEWYRKIGKDIDFDRVYLLEWDAIILASLKDAYKNIPKEGIGLTDLRSIEDAFEGWYWLNNEPWKGFWLELLNRVRKKYNYTGDEKVSIFGLPVFTKSFLENYSKVNIETTIYQKNIKENRWDYKYLPEFERKMVLCHDEIRLPLYAEILGYKMYDTGFLPKDKKEEEEYFNANGWEVKLTTILEEAKNPNGRKVFHPYRKIINLDELER